MGHARSLIREAPNSSYRIGSHLKHHRFGFLAFFFLAVFLAVFFFTADFDFLAAFVFGINFLATFLTFFTAFLAASFVAWGASAIMSVICSSTGFSSSIAPPSLNDEVKLADSRMGQHTQKPPKGP